MSELGGPEWIDEWPGEFLEPETFEEYRRIHLPVKPNPHPPEDREHRDTASQHSRMYGQKFEELLAEKYGSRFNFHLPENRVDRGYDLLIYVLTEEGLLEKRIQAKGCFHSKKSNADLNPRISVPFNTHNGNGAHYVYHLGVYTFVDDIDDMEILGETVLGYDAFDALLNLVEDEDPVGTNIQDKARRKNHALIEWDLAFLYSEKVHRLYEHDGIEAADTDELYEVAKNSAEEYEETDERQISTLRGESESLPAVAP